ncbi:hypothetical protein GOBAR_AA11047 [Gossypium barbadense]|uniref:Uncharacterized protein n=1 Tax=Gossypium barbadense TaxID=3634 RepID=A0A2P5Y252_GOSBA|nr:hypothetical protein GOBAR_AA11047 [Gossypium barbadense]
MERNGDAVGGGQEGLVRVPQESNVVELGKIECQISRSAEIGTFGLRPDGKGAKGSVEGPVVEGWAHESRRFAEGAYHGGWLAQIWFRGYSLIMCAK